MAKTRTRSRHEHGVVAGSNAPTAKAQSLAIRISISSRPNATSKRCSQAAKRKLRPIYDALLKLGLKTGKEAKACPCQTIVPLYRNHVFAQIKPTTQTRIDMGFALGDMKPTGRLIDTGGFAKKDRITHRIPITSLDDIDDEVKHWLKVAYDRDA